MATADVAPSYAPEDSTLPKPWTGLIDGNTSVLYYWNPETNATQYEKPADLVPPPSAVTSAPSLAPIPMGHSQQPNNSTQQNEPGQQMHQQQQQPTYQMPNQHAQYVPNHHAQQYPHMQMNHSVHPSFSQSKEQLIPFPQGQQQQGLSNGNQCGQPNGFPMGRELRRLEGDHMGFSAPPLQQATGPPGDPHFPGQSPRVPHGGDYSVHAQWHIGGPTSVSNQQNDIAFSEMQQVGLDTIHRQQPLGSPAVLNPMGHAMSQHPMGPNLTLGGPSPRMTGPSDFPNVSGVDAYLKHHEITAVGDNVPAPFTTFEATGFPPEILREIHCSGFPSPTPIQAQTWPIALQSRDIVAIAKTGSGKTLGYLIPAFIHLKQCQNNPQIGPTVLILSPTRELATQIQDEAIRFGRAARISCTCLYGGAPKGPQLKEIERGVDIVVATPGRLNDILEMKKINFRQVSFLVLDEADRMLDMGFEPQIRKIVNEIPPRRQTLMYTATWPKEVRKIAGDLLVNPVQVNIGNVNELVANKSITQYVELVSPMEKQRRLEQILRTQERGSRIIIFCSTKRLCDQLARGIGRGYGAAAIHGDKSQGERDHVLNQFRSGRAPVLVATDVAARGLDIKDIRVVINYDFPNGIEDYVHRIGRTGRAGATGISHTFISEQDWKHAADLVKLLEGSSQHVPPEVREMAARGAPSFPRGHGGTSRWDSGGGRGMRDGNGGRYSGRGGDSGGRFRGRNDFVDGGRGFGGPPGGRGWQDCNDNGRDRFNGRREPVERYRGRSYSRSPKKGRSRSRSRS